MTMAGRGLLRVRRGLAALVAACLPVLAGCSHATPPAPVATSLPSAPTWLCPGVPGEAVSPIVGSGPYVLPLYNSKNVYYCRIETAKVIQGVVLKEYSASAAVMVCSNVSRGRR